MSSYRDHSYLLWGVAILFVFLTKTLNAKQTDARHCEVCIATVDQFAAQLTDSDRKSKTSVETKLRSICKGMKGKEERFCWYIGGSENAATGLLGQVAQPLINYLPASKICEKMNKLDAQVCELRYDKKIDWKSVDLNRMRVRELKKILEDWGEACRGCAEKGDFIRRIEELKSVHVPKSEL